MYDLCGLKEESFLYISTSFRNCQECLQNNSFIDLIQIPPLKDSPLQNRQGKTEHHGNVFSLGENQIV